MKKRNIFIIAGKELFSYLNSSAAYVVAVVFLLLSTFLFFRTAYLSGEANLRPFFEILPWFLIFITPALAMRTILSEKEKKTWELLMAHPLSEMEIVAGKFFGALFFLILVLVSTLFLPLSMSFFASLDPGMILAQYLGAIFASGLFLAVGMAASALTNSAVASFLLGGMMNFSLVLLGLEMVVLALPAPLNQLAQELAVLPHVTSVARGLIDLRDLLYFITGTLVFLSIVVFRLKKEWFLENPSEKKKLTLGLSLIGAVVVVLNLVMLSYPLRLDLTQGRQYSLSSGTKTIIRQLPDVLKIKVFVSRDLPGPIRTTFKTVEDLLKDYQRQSDRVSLEKLYPDIDSEAREAALAAGIQEVAFNRIAAGRFEVQAGFLGIELRFGDKTETIPFVENTANLEYEISRKIQKLAGDREKTIGWYDPGLSQSYQALRQALETQYQVKTLFLEEAEKIETDLLLLLGGPGEAGATASAAVADFVKEKGKAVFFLDKVEVNVQTGTASAVKTGLEEILAGFGLSLRDDLVYDLRLGEVIALNSGGVRYLRTYPFWFRALPVKNDFAPLSGIESIALSWPSSIQIESKAGFTYRRLLQGSPAAGRQEGMFSIMPDQIETLPEPSREEILLGAAVSSEAGDQRLVLIGDSDFLADDFAQQAPENIALASSLIDWVMADPALASIRASSLGRSVFQFSNDIQPILLQYINIFLPPFLIAGFGAFWLTKRKRLSRREFKIKDLEKK
ncbi:MAG: Gldg family protein [Candidatus Pacebacteria bacterium]|nr:Gldg family protein [Candidatus Paceibacterota bacterium]